MPDFTVDNTQEIKPQSTVNVPSLQKPEMNGGGDPFSAFVMNGKANQPMWMSKNSQILAAPYLTQLDQTLKYTDPNLGFNPFDLNLEDKYANAHPVATFRNNVLQGGAKFVGAAAEAIATIPLVFYAAGKGDMSKLYDNDITHSVNDFTKMIEAALPVYQTNYERDHPIMKFLNPLKLTSFAGAIGGTINTLGFMGGAIAGAMVEDAIITGLTGGVGLFPALGAQVAKIAEIGKAAKVAVAEGSEGVVSILKSKGLLTAPVRAIGSADELASGGGTLVRGMGTSETAGRGIAGSLENSIPLPGATTMANAEARAAAGLPALTEDAVGAANATNRGLSGAGEAVNAESVAGRTAGGIDASEIQASAKMKDIDATTKNWDRYFKIRDAAKYHIALLSSGMAIGAFQAVEILDQGKAQLTQQYLDLNGEPPKGEELQKIVKQSTESANIAMGMNIALTYLSGRLNFGSLFKPSNQVYDEAILGSFGNIRRAKIGFANEAEAKAGNFKYDVISKSPETRIGKVLLNAQKFGNKSAVAAVEGTTFAALDVITEASLDYNLAKYNAENRGKTASFMDSFMKGIDHTYTTNEGLANIMMGVVVGAFGSPLIERIRAGRGQIKPEQQLKNAVDQLNMFTLKGRQETQVQEGAVQLYLGEKYKSAVDREDKYEASNIKEQMLRNWVHSGEKANSMKLRFDELNMLRDLDGKSFQDHWGMEDNPANRAKMNEYLDGLTTRATEISEDYKRITRLTKNPHDPKTNLKDYESYEAYKDALAGNLSTSRDMQRRLKDVGETLHKLSPGLDIQNAVDITSMKGREKIVSKIKTALAETEAQLKLSENTLGVPKDITDGLKTTREALQSLHDEAKLLTTEYKPESMGVNGERFVNVLAKLYDLHTGTSMTSNEYVNNYKRIGKEGVQTIEIGEKANKTINKDELADALENLQDIYRLGETNLNVQRMYNYLRQGKGASEYMARIEAKTNASFANSISKDGEIVTPEQVKESIDEETRFDIKEPVDIEEATQPEREAIKKAARKKTAGEKLTPEEEALAEAKPSRFAHEVKIQEIVKNKFDERFSNIPEDWSEPGQGEFNVTPKQTTEEEPTSVAKTTKVSDVFGLYSFDKNDINYRSNLYTKLFDKVKGLLRKSQISASYEIPETINEGTTKIIGKNLFRSSFTENVKVNIDGDTVGILRPIDSMWLNAEGTRSIFDLKESEYADVTGNDPSTYKEFMSELNAYKKAYEGLKNELISNAEKGITDNNIVSKYFDLSKNPGSTVQNRFVISKENGLFIVRHSNGKKEATRRSSKAAQDWIDRNIGKLAGADTLLKDLKYKPKGTALISFSEQLVSGGKGGVDTMAKRATVINKGDLTPEELAAINTFLKKTSKTDSKLSNEQVIAKNIGEGRYAVVLPIEGRDPTVVFARNAESTDTERSMFLNYFLKIGRGELHGEELKNVVEKIKNSFFIANTDREVKGTMLNIVQNGEDGIALRVYNKAKKVEKIIPLDKAELATLKDFGQLMQKLDLSILQAGNTDRNLSRLEIKIESESLKRQIPNDEKISKLSQVDEVIKVATTPQVFENYNLEFKPKTEFGTKEAGGEPKPPTGETPIGNSVEQLEALTKKLSETNKAYTSIKGFDESFKGFIDWVKDKKESMGYYGSAIGHLTELQKNSPEKVTELLKQFTEDKDFKKYNDGTDSLPITPEAAPKTEAELKAEQEASDKKIIEDETNKLNNNYTKKLNTLKQDFERGLTTQEKAIKNALNDDASLADDLPGLARVAGVTPKDISDYSKKAAIYNERYSAYDAIRKQKTQNLQEEGAPIFIKTKHGMEIIAKELFGLKADEANAVARIFEANANAWVVRTGNKVSEYFKELGFASRLDNTMKEGVMEQQPAVKQIIDYFKLKKVHVYANMDTWVSENGKAGIPLYDRIKELIKQRGLDDTIEVRLNLTHKVIEFRPKGNLLFQLMGKEENIKFNNWFKDSVIKNKNGEPIEVFHGTKAEFDAFGNAYGDVGMHFGNETQANKARINSFGIGEGKLLKGYLNIKNPLNTGDIFGHTVPHLLKGLKDAIQKDVNVSSENKESRIKEINNLLKKYNAEDGKSTKQGQTGAVETEYYRATEKLIKSFGYDGITYNNRFEGKGKSYVIFDPSQFKSVDSKEFNPKDDRFMYQGAKAAYDTLTNTIYSLTNPDVTSPLHEMAHKWEPELDIREKETVMNWAGTDGWTRETSEKFATGFEVYLAEGKAPTKGLQGIFDKFAKWLTNVIERSQALFGKEFKLNDPMREIYDRMLDAKKAKLEPLDVNKNTEEIFKDNPDLTKDTTKEEYESFIKELQGENANPEFAKTINQKDITFTNDEGKPCA